MQEFYLKALNLKKLNEVEFRISSENKNKFADLENLNGNGDIIRARANLTEYISLS
jgi:hypothetical protein